MAASTLGRHLAFHAADACPRDAPTRINGVTHHEKNKTMTTMTQYAGCPTISAMSSPQSEVDDEVPTTASSNTETLSADESCASFCTTRPSEPIDKAVPFGKSGIEENLAQQPPLSLERVYEDHLSVEMLTLYEELLPTRASYDRRMGLVQKIEKILNAEWPSHNIRVHLFGSSVNDLGSSESDVDLCITTSWNGLRNVRVLAKLFRKCGMQNVVCIPRAKVPIVRLFDPESQLACDINVNNTLALQNTEMIKTYVALDPRVRPLAMVIKHWTRQRKIKDAANGGTLSTYTWACIIINFLQMREPPILPVLHQLTSNKSDNDFCTDIDSLRGFGRANQESLGGLLFAFFRRYAYEFDYEEQVVSVRHGRYLNKLEKGWHIGRNKQSFCVEEPFNVSRNLGNSADSYSVNGLLLEFRRAFHLLANHASLDVVCSLYENPIPAELPPPKSPALITSSSASPPLPPPPPPMESRESSIGGGIGPSIILPVHPYAVDYSNDSNKKRADDGFLHPSFPFVSLPPSSSPYEWRYTEPANRPRFNSVIQYAPAPALAPFRVRHSSHPLPCYPTTNNSGSNNSVVAAAPSPPPAPPIPITIALPPHSSSARQPNVRSPENNGRTMDSIFARYHDQRPLLTGSGSSVRHQSVDDLYRRRRSSASQPLNGNGIRRSSTRRRSSVMDSEWPSISPSSSAVRPVAVQPNGRRRWSTVKKPPEPDPSSTAAVRLASRRTMADVVKQNQRDNIYSIATMSTATNSPQPPSSRGQRQYTSSHHQSSQQQQQQQQRHQSFKPKGSWGQHPKKSFSNKPR